MRELIERIARFWTQEGAPRKAAALAYYTVFAFAPLLVIAGSLASVVFGTSTATDAIEDRLAETFGPEVASDLVTAFSQTLDSSGGVFMTLIAVGVLVYGAGRLLFHMQRIFDDLLGVRIKDGTPWLTVALRRLVPFILVLGSAVVVAGAILMQAVISWMRSTWIVEEVIPLQVPEGASQLASSLVVAWLVIAALYRLLPDGRLRARRLLVGAGAAALAYTVGQRVFFWYVGWDGAQTLSGAAGTFVLFLIWVHFTMTSVLGGLILARARAETHGEEVVPASYAVRVERIPVGAADGSASVTAQTTDDPDEAGRPSGAVPPDDAV